jgi:hypothetical protein
MNDDFNEEGGRSVLALIVRGTGFVLVVIGLVVSLLTINEALKLYLHPQRIERFALAIENGSNIDKSLSSLRESTATEAAQDNDADTPAPATGQATPVPAQKADNIRVSYFFAWIIDLLLLLLVARIGLATIKTGGELALYDMQIKRFAKMLIRGSGNR